MTSSYACAAEAREAIRQQCRNGWPGARGIHRAAVVDSLLDRVLPEYSRALGIPEEQLLLAFEASRKVTAPNYYQDANFPTLDGVAIFEDAAAFRRAHPAGQFICPACGGHSTDASECNTGIVWDKRRCDWKAYGLFGTMGKGMRLIVREKFLESPRVMEIFMPVDAGSLLTKKD